MPEQPTVQCPHCGTHMSNEARFCPGCGTPRTTVAQELQRASEMTGIPYETLLEQARQKERQRAPQLPFVPSPGTSTPSCWIAGFKLVGGMLLVGFAIAAIGLFFPLLIAGVILLVILADQRPAVVTRIAEHRWAQRLPASLRRTPMRFAAAIALVASPVALCLGLFVYASVLASVLGPDDGDENGPAVEMTATEILSASSEPTGTPSPTPTRTPETPTSTEFQVVPTNPPTPTPAPTDTPVPTVTPEPTDTPVPTATATPEPTATEEPAPSPTPIPVIQGLAAVDVTLNLEDRGFDCRGPDMGTTLVVWTCEYADPLGTYSVYVEIYGYDATRIDQVDTTVLNYGSAPTGEIATPFLMFIATLPYEDNDPERAQVWVAEHIDASAELTIGSARFVLTPGERVRNLEITAVGAF